MMSRKVYTLVTALLLLLLLAAPALAEPVGGANKTVELSSGGSRNVTALQIDLSDPDIRIFSVHAGSRVGDTAPLKDIASQVAGAEYEVVCAVNGTFFDAYTAGAQRGMGTVIASGKMIYKLDGTFIGFGANNQVKMDWIHIEYIGYVNGIRGGDYSFYVHNWNRVLPAASSYREAILTPAFGASSGDTDMRHLVVRNDVIQSMGQGVAAIPGDGYVYLYPESSPYNDGRFQVGDRIETEQIFYNREQQQVDWSGINNITGVGPSLVKNGAKTANAAAEGWTDVKLTENAGQRSFIGFDAGGTKLIMGTAPNCTISQLGDVAMAYGLYQAMNLDGGASSGLLFNGNYLTTPGRNLSNAIVVVRTKQAAAPAPAVQAPASTGVNAITTGSAVLVDGRQISFQAYNINGNNYFKLRALAAALSDTAKPFDVSWDGGQNAISLTSGQAYAVQPGDTDVIVGNNKNAVSSAATLYVDGVKTQLEAYNIDGVTYFKLRDIMRAFDIGLSWDSVGNTIVIDTSAGYSE